MEMLTFTVRPDRFDMVVHLVAHNEELVKFAGCSEGSTEDTVDSELSHRANTSLDSRGVAVGAIGAIVMASASIRGSLVYTSDVEDLERLTAIVQNVHVRSI